jgi:hypothetical protein
LETLRSSATEGDPGLRAVALSLLLGTGVATFFAVRANANAVRTLEERNKAEVAERGRREQLLLEALMAEARAKRFSGRVGQRCAQRISCDGCRVLRRVAELHNSG